MASTKEEIWKIADDLGKRGEKPTLAAVRKAAGGGSYTTISEAMAEWRERKDKAEFEKASFVPVEIEDVLLSAGKSIWKVARERADKEVAGLKDELKIKQEAFEKERSETLTLADQLTEELEKVKINSEKQKEENKKQSQKFTETEKENAELRIENAKLQERFDNSEKHIKEMAGQNERLHDQLVELAKAGKPDGS